MIPFKTTPEQVMNLATIMVEMGRAGLDQDYIVAASELARIDQGVYDLMALWIEAENDPEERNEIVADLQESIDEYREAPSTPQKRPYIKFDQLDDVARRVMAEKAKLRQLIDKNGGVSAVAQRAGIPQPSLSRMLSSPSIPRRSTLYKLANAMDVSETEIAMEWTR